MRCRVKQVYVVMKYDEVLISAGDVLAIFDTQEKAELYIQEEYPTAAFEVHDVK